MQLRRSGLRTGCQTQNGLQPTQYSRHRTQYTGLSTGRHVVWRPLKQASQTGPPWLDAHGETLKAKHSRVNQHGPHQNCRIRQQKLHVHVIGRIDDQLM